MASNIRRLLSATRRGCKFDDDPSRIGMLRHLLERGYPFGSWDFEIVPLRSGSFHSEYSNAGAGSIILDDALTDVLRVLTCLLGVKNFHEGITRAAIHPWMADACANQGDFARAAFFAIRGLERLDQTKLLTHAAFQRDNGDDHECFILLHEAAHGLIHKEDPTTREHLVLAREALSKVAGIADKFRETGPTPYHHLAGARWEDIDEAAVQRQLEKFSKESRENPKLAEEVACDLLAIFGYANLVIGEPLMFGEWEELSPVCSRQLAVAFARGLLTLKLQQFMAGLNQAARNLSSSSPPDQLEAGLLGSTARSNALTHILTSVLQVRGSEVSQIIFHNEVRELIEALSFRLLDPCEKLLEMSLDGATFGTHFSETMGRTFAAEPDPGDFGRFQSARQLYPV